MPKLKDQEVKGQEGDKVYVKEEPVAFESSGDNVPTFSVNGETVNMATRSRPAGNLRSGSPVAAIGALSGTKKTEQRRSRSRSRQRIDSEFIRRVDDIPIIHNVMEYVMSTYGVVKDANPLVKSSLESSENVAYWLKEKAEKVAEVTKLDGTIKQIDTAAANGVVKLGQTRANIRHRIDKTQEDIQTRVRENAFHVRKQVENAQYAIFEGIQTLLDHVEERFEPVMLKPSPEAEKLSTQPVLSMTFGRMVDMTYRLNLGILQYSARRAREMVNPESWNEVARKHFSPEKIRIRAKIIQQGVLAPSGSFLRYMDDKELTELDKKLIQLSRSVLDSTRNLAQSMAEIPSKSLEAAKASIFYTGGVLKHLSEARSLNDLTGIGLNESRRGLEGLREYFPFANSFGVLDKTIDWMTMKEKETKMS